MKKLCVVILSFILLTLVAIAFNGGFRIKFLAEKNLEWGLKKKYGKEFAIERIWEDPYGTLYGATCYPKDEPNDKFRAEIRIDFSYFNDTYIPVVVSKNLTKQMYEMAVPVFGEDCYIKSEIVSFAYYRETDLSLSFDELYKKYPKIVPSVDIFIRCQTDINKDVQSRIIDCFIDDIIERGIKNALFSFFYYRAESFEDAYVEFEYRWNEADYYNDPIRCYNRVNIEIANGCNTLKGLTDEKFIN